MNIMPRFINGDRPRTSPRSRSNCKMSPAKFEKFDPPSDYENGEGSCENTKTIDQPTKELTTKNMRRKRCPLRRSARKITDKKLNPGTMKRTRQKKVGLPVPKPTAAPSTSMARRVKRMTRREESHVAQAKDQKAKKVMRSQIRRCSLRRSNRQIVNRKLDSNLKERRNQKMVGHSESLLTAKRTIRKTEKFKH